MKSNMKPIARQNKSISKFLFSDSLESHMKKYMQDVKLNEMNQQYQLAEGEVVREAERYNLSQVETMVKLEQLKADFKRKITESLLIPLSKSNASEPTQPSKEEYKPLTASEYENRRLLIDELKYKLQKINKDKTMLEIFPTANKREVDKLLDDVLKSIIDKGLKKQEILNVAADTVNTLIRESVGKKIDPQLKKELLDDLKSRNLKMSKEDKRKNKMNSLTIDTDLGTGKYALSSSKEKVGYIGKRKNKKVFKPTNEFLYNLNQKGEIKEKTGPKKSVVKGGGLRNAKGQFIKTK